ncbi:MAG TPA: EAL domain-containing protein [Pseudonocardiaceae bacterium]|jgi:diguanylate cyclase (GGDEF)-like protein/PAS domain S-box-containing protein|nr:EAL domain-containing protein [Pseudonocardiaceae bacterium]
MSRTDREVFARRWADEIVGASYVSMEPDEIVAHLLGLTHQLVEAALATEFDPSIGRRIGVDLVGAHFTGTETLGATVAFIVERLPDLLDQIPQGIDIAGRVARLTGNIAAGYASALRERSLDEQDSIYRAGLRARRQAEHALTASEARFRGVFHSSPVAIAISEPDGRIIQTNRSLDDTLGYSPGELLGRELTELFSAEDRPIVEERYRGLTTGRDTRFRVRFPLRLADGEAAMIYLDATVLLDDEQVPQCIVTMIDDITDLRLIEQQLNHQALHDVQTGLPNRQYFVTHLEKVLGQLDPSAVVTLMHLDLDGFSAINDGLGHDAGERLLDVVARRLEWVVADQQAMVARLGADEYAILIEPGDSVLDVGAFAEIINTELAEPFYIDGIGVAVTATIGIVQRRVAATSAEELMGAASATLRRIRGRGKRQWTLFDPEIDAANRAKLKLAAAMPGALETGELQVTFQPVVMLNGGRLVGVEAALSWQHPQLGRLSNEQCVQAAERTGVVHEVGQWLLRTAAAQAVSWRERIGAGVPPVMINLTPSQTQDPDLVARVRAVLQETGLAPGELELRAPLAAIRTATGELTDEGGGQAEDNLRVLTELGVRAGLYDFGGGIRGLRCVADLPVCVLRIAQPLSHQLAEDSSRIMAQAAQALVHILRGTGVDVVAPVDSAEQAADWAHIGANWAIGALFGPPGPAQRIELLLERAAIPDPAQPTPNVRN